VMAVRAIERAGCTVLHLPPYEHTGAVAMLRLVSL
jgi:hypothetical protein